MNFFKTTTGAWIITILIAGLFLGLGYEAGQQALSRELEEVRKSNLQEAERAGRLHNDNRRLQERLQELERELGLARVLPPAGSPAQVLPAEPEAKSAKIIGKSEFYDLRTDEATELLDGNLIMVLEEVSNQSPRRAKIAVRPSDGPVERVVLTAGEELHFKFDGELYRLLLRKVNSYRSIQISITPLP